MDPRAIRILGAFGAVVVGLMFGLAFCIDDDVSCDEVAETVDPTGRTEIVLLADGRSPALERLFVNATPATMGALFTGSGLGFAAAGGETAQPGVITLATYDSTGAVRLEGSFDIAGVGESSGGRKKSAKHQVRCLKEAVDGLPDSETGDLLRSLDGARGVAHGDSVAVLATGLSRSTVEGQPLANSMATAEGRAGALALIVEHDFLPDVEGLAALWFLRPGEGARSRTVEVGFESFTTDLCLAVELERCGGGSGVP